MRMTPEVAFGPHLHAHTCTFAHAHTHTHTREYKSELILETSGLGELPCIRLCVASEAPWQTELTAEEAEA